MIRPAAPSDLPAIAQLYDAVLDREEQGPVYTNWKRGQYPTAATAEDALSQGTLYVGEEAGRLWGAAILNRVQLPEYACIPWTIPAAPEAVHVIHTLCIHPSWARQGLARTMVAALEGFARDLGSTVMRLDTWEGNLPANALYPKLGYHFAGGAEFNFQNCIREVLNCYEKAL